MYGQREINNFYNPVFVIRRREPEPRYLPNFRQEKHSGCGCLPREGFRIAWPTAKASPSNANPGWRVDVNYPAPAKAPFHPQNALQGSFRVGNSGEVQTKFLDENGSYKSEIAIFSLRGMEHLSPGSADFNKEAARRALSNSEKGHVVISERNKIPKEQKFKMQPGDDFAVMMVPNGKIKDVLDNPNIDGDKKPLYSINQANPQHGNNFVELSEAKDIYAFEDIRFDGNSDKDYDDIILKIAGAEDRDVSGLPAGFNSSKAIKRVLETA